MNSKIYSLKLNHPYFAAFTAGEYFLFMKTKQINLKISFALSKSKQFNKREKQKTAKVLCSFSLNLTCRLIALTNLCIV
jgi:hypothetical protein